MRRKLCASLTGGAALLVIALLAMLLAPARADVSYPFGGGGGGYSPYGATAQDYFLFSLLEVTSTPNLNDLKGPKEFTSPDGLNLAPFGNGASDLFTVTAFRDPRILKVAVGNGTYVYFMGSTNNTSNSPGSNSIGLAYSFDLIHWTTGVSTPNWSSLFTGSQASIWNGGWFQDPVSGNIYLYFATSDWVGPNGTTTPYVVQFTPNVSSPGSSSFGTPQEVSLSVTRAYADVMAVYYDSANTTYYMLLQSGGSNATDCVELYSSSSPTGTWTLISGSANGGFFGESKEGGAFAVVNGTLTMYEVAVGGGSVFYSQTSASPPTSGWSSPTALGNNSLLGHSYDWVDVVPVNDTQTDIAVRSQQGSGGRVELVQGISPNNVGPLINIFGNASYPGVNLFSGSTYEAALGLSQTSNFYIFTIADIPLDFGTDNNSRWWIGGSGGFYSNGFNADPGANNIATTGYVLAEIDPVTKTSNYSVASGDSGKHFDNAGASGSVTFSLPAAAAGLNYCFAVYAAETLEVLANGSDQIYFATSETSSENITGASVGMSVCLEAHGTGKWITSASEGSWTVH